tara:strand:- start:520 stop:672 length:153 start_codon:yes stop_codon:yes gene_type:complete
MMIIDGKKEAELLREEIKKEILEIKESKNKVPGLTVILVELRTKPNLRKK